jgi:hypothetical protein
MRGRDTVRGAFTVLAIAAVTLLLCSGPAMAQIRYHPPPEEVPEEPVPEQASSVAMAIGGVGQDVSGNRSRFDQYYTPPLGGHPSVLRIETISRRGDMMSLLDLRDITEPGRSASLAVRDMDSSLEFEGSYRHDEFHESFSPGAPAMRRDDYGFELKLPVSRGLDLDVGTGYLALDGLSDMAPIDWSCFDVGTRAYWRRGSLALDGQYAAESFRQLGGPEVSGMDRVASFGMRLSGGSDRHVLEARATLQNTQLDGFAQDLEREAFAVTLSSELRPRLTLRGRFLTQDTGETITQNSYEMSREEAQASLLYGGLRKTFLEAGVQRSETEYPDRYDRFVSKPETTTFWTKLRFRPLRGLRLSASVVRRDAQDVPPRPSDFGQIEGPIVTSDEHQRVNVDASYDFSDRLGVAGGVRNDEWGMSPEGVETTLETTSIAAWVVASDRLTVTGSFLSLDWGVAGVDGAGLGEGDYVSKVNAYSAGAVLQLSGRSAASATFTHSNGFGAVDTRDDALSLWWHRLMSDGTELRLSYTRQDFEEGIPGSPNDFEANVIGGAIARRF